MFTDLGGFLGAAIVVGMVVVLAIVMAYAIARWRQAPRDARTERAKNEAVKQEYKGPDRAV
jgi:hypothetical protein